MPGQAAGADRAEAPSLKWGRASGTGAPGEKDLGALLVK